MWLQFIILAAFSLSFSLLFHKFGSFPALLNLGSRLEESVSKNITTATIGIRKHHAILDDPHVLNIHVVPHSHDDVGWLKTVEEYYYGLNNSIQNACVRDILDSVTVALMESKERTFVVTEQRFFHMWWQEQPDAVKSSVRQLVADSQLTFVNGGWCMHDEATTHYMGMIDQTTLGHSFLKQEFNYTPRVGWQLDPFGHSKTQASLMTSRAGMDALYFGRIDYQDLELRHKTQECEGLWSTSPSSEGDGLKEAVFWGLTGSYYGGYASPNSFLRGHPWVEKNRTELVELVKAFIEEIKLQSDRTKGNHILLTMGEDFQYQRASETFADCDLLIQSLQNFQHWGLVDVLSILGPRFQRINIFYSTPEYYTEMKFKETSTNKQKTSITSHLSEGSAKSQQISVNWSIKEDDFFPYADRPHAYWTGYFTSRTAFKRLERISSAFLFAARQIEAFPEKQQPLLKDAATQPLLLLEDASGVAQHHDAVTGTAKQHVSDDYTRRLQAGIDTAARYVEEKLKRVLLRGNKIGLKSYLLQNLTFCQFESICEISQEATKRGIKMDIFAVIYNALGSSKSRIVRLPVSVLGRFSVTEIGTGNATTQVVTSTSSPFADSMIPGAAPYTLFFRTGPLPPLGASVFLIQQSIPTTALSAPTKTRSLADVRLTETVSHTKSAQQLRHEVSMRNVGNNMVVSNEILTVQFDRKSGEIRAISTNETDLNVTQSWGYYTSFDNTKDFTDKSFGSFQNSGAYIFRPSQPDQNLETVRCQPTAKFVATEVGVEVHLMFEKSWIRQVTRVLKDLPYVEVEYCIGEIPIKDGRGKEVVTRFSTPIQSDGVFHTDSNAREFMQRRRDFRSSYPLTVVESIAGNYYPINGGIYIEDNSSSLSVLVDRSHGGTSLTDGTIELMTQRRVLADDQRGVGEPLNETDGGVTSYPPFGKAERWGRGIIVRGTYRLMVGKAMDGASTARSEMNEAFSTPLIFVASSLHNETSELPLYTFTALNSSLPPNIMIVTFKKLHTRDSNDYYLLRLGHQYAIDENKELSRPVELDLDTLFSQFKLISVIEMTLTGNQLYKDWAKTRIDWTGSGAMPQSIKDNSTTITMQPMDVRTFVVNLAPL